MKRRLLQLCIVGALALSGWGGVLASAMCAHARSGAHGGHRPQRQPDAAHATHPEQTQSAQTEAVGGHCQHGQRAARSERAADSSESGVGAPRGGGGRPCTHCLANPQGTASTAAVNEQTRRGKLQQTAAPVEHTAGARDTAYAPTVSPKQGSPPGHAPRRHLVLSVFLI